MIVSKIRHFKKSAMKCVWVATLLAAFLPGPKAHADDAREFVLSCAYGALAGTIVGAATLAFTDHPGDNLNRIARGASFGLYGGILLGLYVVYAVPAESDDGANSYGLAPLPKSNHREPAALQVYPLLSENHGLEGGAFRYSVLQF
jgi:hypothetical protein